MTPWPRTADEIEEVLAREDPDLVEAAREVDRSLLAWSLSLTPLERLRVCSCNARGLEQLRRGTFSR